MINCSLILLILNGSHDVNLWLIGSLIIRQSYFDLEGFKKTNERNKNQ